MLSVVGAYEYAGRGDQFCAEHFVRPKVQHYNLSADIMLTVPKGDGRNPQAWNTNWQHRASQLPRYECKVYLEYGPTQ
jgi:hypothetical protein